MRLIPRLGLAASLLLLPACANTGGLGQLGNILGSVMGQQTGQTTGPAQQQQIQAEVQQVDTRNSLLSIRTTQGQTGNVRFDQQTLVVYNNQQYPVTALERGDVVNLQLVQNSSNDIYVARVDVVKSIQDRNAGR